MKSLVSGFRLMRSPWASGIARFVAPTDPLGRIGSALVLTAVLAGVQLGLVAGHSGLDLCQLDGRGCSPPQPIAGGRLLEGPSSRAPQAPPAGNRRSGPSTSNPARPISPTLARPPALPTSERTRNSHGRPGKMARSADLRGFAAPQRRSTDRTASTLKLRHGAKGRAIARLRYSPQKTRSTTVRACLAVRR